MEQHLLRSDRAQLTFSRKSVTASSLPPHSPRPSRTSFSTSSRRRSTLPPRVSYGSTGTYYLSLYRLNQITNTTCHSGLDFTAQALRHNLSNSSKELADSFREAYAGTLKPHHSFVVKPIFSAAMSATPYRKDFYAKLGQDNAKVQEQLEKYLAALEKIVATLNKFLDKKEAKW